MAEYKKPKPNTDSTGDNGYPVTDVNKGITRSTMRGGGAATKGKQFASQINLDGKTKRWFGWK